VRPETPRAGSARPEQPLGKPRTVAIVDLDRRVRAALADALRLAGIEVVGTAGETSEALQLIEQGADVLIVDPRLPELVDGHALVERVSRDWPDVHFVIMGWAETEQTYLPAKAGTFVAKSASPEEFVAATLAACGFFA
jgi:DNA-binding NarL/FixJ family response regulator